MFLDAETPWSDHSPQFVLQFLFFSFDALLNLIQFILLSTFHRSFLSRQILLKFIFKCSKIIRLKTPNECIWNSYVSSVFICSRNCRSCFSFSARSSFLNFSRARRLSSSICSFSSLTDLKREKRKDPRSWSMTRTASDKKRFTVLVYHVILSIQDLHVAFRTVHPEKRSMHQNHSNKHDRNAYIIYMRIGFRVASVRWTAIHRLSG